MWRFPAPNYLAFVEGPLLKDPRKSAKAMLRLG